jgi:geranylgeranyl reductase family protein
MHYDVIVVGAGPAGSAAATALARAGCSVLVLEKSKHPRHKSCGGGLSARLLPFLDPDVKEVIEQTVYHISFRLKKKEVTFSSTAPVAYLARRPRFDAYLADKAAAAGAVIREECPMLRWRERPDGVEVESRFGKETGSFLIAADGGTSRIARQMHARWKKKLAYALEAEMPFPPLGSSEGGEMKYRETVFFDLTVSKGYGWVFPKMGEAAIGIGGFKGKEKRPRSLYRHFLCRNGLLSERAPSPPHGCVIPFYDDSRFPLVEGRTLLIGDAGSLVDPLFGEGIYYAIRSGQMAASAVISELKKGVPIQSYDEAVRSVFYPEFEVARKVAYWVYSFPWVFLEANRRHPKAMELYFKVLRGEWSYRAFWKEVRLEFLRKWNPFKQSSAASSRP